MAFFFCKNYFFLQCYYSFRRCFFKATSKWGMQQAIHKYLFCNIINVVAVTFDTFNVSLSSNFFKKKRIILPTQTLEW